MLAESEIAGGREALLEVSDLVKHFPLRGGLLQRTQGVVQAVDGVSFSIAGGETLGLVGESGSGKTTVGRTILRLVEPTSGSIRFDGTDLMKLRGRTLKDMRRQMQIIFQDPYTALDPRMNIGDCVGEGLRIHHIGTPAEQRDRVLDTLKRVGLEEYHVRRFPGEFSGGQRQRIGIARALALRPKFIVADEPVSVLDVSIQSQVLNLLKDLQQEFNLTFLFIAHNMSVVEHISDRVAVMYLGKLVESAPRQELFARPLHPYTQALMSAIPVADPHARRQRIILKGDIPSPTTPPAGCRFHTRCPVAIDHCAVQEPRLVQVVPGHQVACWRLN